MGDFSTGKVNASKMGYAEYLRAIRKYWWIVLLTLTVALGAGVYLTLATQREYASTVTFFVQTPSDQLNLAAQGDTFGQKRVNSYVQLANTDRLLIPVLAETKVPLTVAELSAEVKASGDLNTVLLTVTVTDPVPQRADQIARSISVQFVKVVSALETVAGAKDSSVRLELVSGPKLDPRPVRPDPNLNYGIAIILGLLVGMTLAVLKEFSDTSIRSSQALEKASGATILGVVAYDDTAAKQPLIIEGHAKSVRAEAFRQLRTNLQFVDVDRPAKIVVITSSVPDEGKSSTATNLAVIFAEAGKKVLLIEGDLRRPRVAEYLGLESAVGLTNLLAGQVELDDVLQPWGRGGLTVLPSGSVPPNPSELLESNQMASLLESMRHKFDVVLIDTPPLLPVTDGAILAARADGALLVVHHGTTKKQQVALAVSSLHKVQAKLLGCVLNMAPTRGVDAYAYGYGSYEQYADSTGNSPQRPSLAEYAVLSAAGETAAAASLDSANKHRLFDERV